MSICKFRSDKVGLDGFIFSMKVIEEGAKIECGEHVVWVHLEGFPVVVFGEIQFVTLLKNSTQIYVRLGVLWLKFDGTPVGRWCVIRAYRFKIYTKIEPVIGGQRFVPSLNIVSLGKL